LVGVAENAAGKEDVDLGTGIGTVGLALLWALGEWADLTCVEAQYVSFRLLKENILGNGLTGCVRAIHGDIRDLDLGERFPSNHRESSLFCDWDRIAAGGITKAHTRFELRGNVGGYARAAKRHITDDGLFVFCFPFQQKSRCIKPITDVGFRHMAIRDVVPMKSKPPLFSLYCASVGFTGAVTEEKRWSWRLTTGSIRRKRWQYRRAAVLGPKGNVTG
jgi:tRNA1(Val) A37 N6-methylase TrmN6